MKICLDVYYGEKGAVAAGVVFRDWQDAEGVNAYVVPVDSVQPYEPGQFYKRELPCLLTILEQVQEPIETVIIDGYVWLRNEEDPGLGTYLYEACKGKLAVIGVAKSRFQASTGAREVFRGGSDRPLFVTARGIDLEQAAQNIVKMHGLYRLPTLIRQADQLCRGILP